MNTILVKLNLLEKFVVSEHTVLNSKGVYLWEKEIRKMKLQYVMYEPQHSEIQKLWWKQLKIYM